MKTMIIGLSIIFVVGGIIIGFVLYNSDNNLSKISKELTEPLLPKIKNKKVG